MEKVALKEFYAKVGLTDNFIQVDPAVLGTGANTVVWNPGSDTNEDYLVEFELVNHSSSATSPLAHVGVDVAATGTLTHYFWRGQVPIKTATGFRGPFVMAGDDDLMAWCGTSDAVTISFRIRKISR